MECPKCRRQMTSATDTKSYCMKCDILVHSPSGVAFTGHADEDKFIGSVAYLQYPLEKLFSMPKEDQKKVVKSETRWVFLPRGDAFSCPLPLVEKNREKLEATLGPHALILTWKGNKGIEAERIPYRDMTGAVLVDIVPKQPSQATRVASMAIGALAAGPIGAVAAATHSVPSYQLLRVKTAARNYQMFVPEPQDWVDRLHEQGVKTGRTTGYVLGEEEPKENLEPKQG